MRLKETATSADLDRILLDDFLLFLAAKVLGQAARQPALVGELVAGVLVGPAVLGWVRDRAGSTRRSPSSA